MCDWYWKTEEIDKDVRIGIETNDDSGNISIMFTKYGFLENKMKPLTM